MSFKRLYSITEEPMACENCRIIMKAEQAHPLSDGNLVCPRCGNELEAALKEEYSK